MPLTPVRPLEALEKSMYPDHLQYTAEHEWVTPSPSPEVVVRVGITAFAQEALGDIVYVSLPAVGDEVTAGESVGELESTKSVSDVYSPITGTVVTVNQDAVDNPALINADPYSGGWLFEVEVAHDSTSSDLLDADAYADLVAG